MITVEIGTDAVDRNGLVILWKAVDAAMAAAGNEKRAIRPSVRWHPPLLLDTWERWPVLVERAIWYKVDAGVAQGILNPIDTETHAYRTRYDCANGVVPLSELIEWGHRVKLYVFKLAERNDELPADAGSKSEAVKVRAGAMVAIDEPKTKNWILRIQTEAARRWKALRDAGASPTKNNIKNDLATWCKETNVLTDGDINPNAEYIYRHVLRKWTPPKG